MIARGIIEEMDISNIVFLILSLLHLIILYFLKISPSSLITRGTNVNFNKNIVYMLKVFIYY